MMVLDTYNARDTTFTTVPAKREITFRDLLTHSSGIDYAGIGSQTANAIYAKAGIPSGLGSVSVSLLDKMKALAKQPLFFQPGAQWRYGLNMDLLGCLIEVISGTDLDTFFQKNITGPLGMKDTYFNVPESKFSRLATVYTEDGSHKIIPWSHTYLGLDPDYPMHKTQYFSGGAGMTSTAFDYAIFLQMLLNGGVYNGHRVLSKRAVEIMTSNQLEINGSFTPGDHFGLGFGITGKINGNKGPKNEGTFYWGGYYGTTYWVDPKVHLVCLIMTQHGSNSHSELTSKISNLIYSSLLD
jgi:CubicO group peptidase (beta-lactamase class C family)